MLLEKLEIRAVKKEVIIHNIEIQFIKDEIDSYTLKNYVNVILNKKFNFFYFSN